MKILLPPALLLLTAFGCRAVEPGYVPTPPVKVEPVSTDVAGGEGLMPLAVGNRWSYRMKTETLQGGKTLAKEEASASFRVASGKGDEIVLLLETNGKALDAQGIRATADGLYQTSSSLANTPTVPPQPLVLLPAKPGRRFAWSGRAAMPDGSISKGTAESEILAEQVVDTAAGPVSAIPVVTRTKFPSGESENTAWYRPGVGLVRYRQATTSHDRTVVLVLSMTNTNVDKRP